MRKGPMLVAFLAAVVVAAGCASTSEPTADAPESETYVLVHGSAHGGAWKRVAEPLRASGHRVYTPTLTRLVSDHISSRRTSPSMCSSRTS